jgi:hypothetical protein
MKGKIVFWLTIGAIALVAVGVASRVPALSKLVYGSAE